MRVMWFTNIALPAMDRYLGMNTRGSGWWMTCLLGALQPKDQVELAVVAALPGQADGHFSYEGVDYFVVGQPHPKLARWRDERKDLPRCAEIVRRWRPDVVHFHGTERFYGLLKVHGLIDTPAVVSLQGLMGPYARAALGGLSPGQVFRAGIAGPSLRIRSGGGVPQLPETGCQGDPDYPQRRWCPRPDRLGPQLCPQPQA